jgi:two-component system sensor histidine kinase ChiS
MARRAVVVEDMEAVARALSSILNLDGFEQVHVVTDPREAVRVIRQVDPELVVLDIRMPHLSGAQVIQALGKRPAHRPGLLIYSATAREELDKALTGTGLGYDAFLAKPATLQELRTAIESVRSQGAPA